MLQRKFVFRDLEENALMFKNLFLASAIENLCFALHHDNNKRKKYIVRVKDAIERIKKLKLEISDMSYILDIDDDMSVENIINTIMEFMARHCQDCSNITKDNVKNLKVVGGSVKKTKKKKKVYPTTSKKIS